jgi:hypothetical protein
MANELTQSTANEPIPFLLIDSTLHIAGKTSLTPTVTISKNGGAFITPAGAITELGNGWYKIAANATDTDTLGPLIVHAEASGADPVDLVYQVVKQNRRTASMDLVLAKTTNLTGLNDILATDVVSSGPITTNAGAVTTVTTVTNLTSLSASAIWSYGSRTLTQSTTSIINALTGTGGKVTARRGDSLSLAFTGLGDISSRSSLWFTAKKHKSDTDTQAQLMISSGSGLMYLNGGAPNAASNGAIAVNDSASGNITITLAATETKNMAIYPSYFYDVQMLSTSGSVYTLAENFMEVTDDVTRAIV